MVQKMQKPHHGGVIKCSDYSGLVSNVLIVDKLLIGCLRISFRSFI